MRTMIRQSWRWMLIGVIVAASSAAPGQAAAPLERAALDKSVYASLKDVINRGADFYNSGDPAACYHLYHGALMAIESVLDHYPELQKEIRNGLADAERNPDIRRRAFALRGVLDKVRATTNPKKPVATLWDRLGGEKNVKKIVDDFTAAVTADPKVNFTRSGKIKLDDQKLAALKKAAVAFISSASGGPIKYTGKDIKEAHKGMGITNAEFDAAAGHFKAALEKNGVKPADVEAAMEAVESTRKAVVEKKGPDARETPKNGAAVSGKVKLNGQPVVEGEIRFVPGGELKDKAYSGALDESGNYKVPSIPPGEYAVTIAPKKTKIPARYGKANTSGLKFTVKKGTNVFDIELVE